MQENTENWITGYKVVRRETEDVYKPATTGAVQILRYKIGKITRPINGGDMCVFRSIEQAKAWIGKPCIILEVKYERGRGYSYTDLGVPESQIDGFIKFCIPVLHVWRYDTRSNRKYVAVRTIFPQGTDFASEVLPLRVAWEER